MESFLFKDEFSQINTNMDLGEVTECRNLLKEGLIIRGIL